MIKRRSLIVSILALVLASGCGARSSGDVSGKVTFKGAPLPSGTIALINQDGSVASGVVEDGVYHIASASLGFARITVQSHPAPLPMVPPDPRSTAGPLIMPKKTTVIPQRYQDPAKSGLTYTVIAGSQKHDIILESR